MVMCMDNNLCSITYICISFLYIKGNICVNIYLKLFIHIIVYQHHVKKYLLTFNGIQYVFFFSIHKLILKLVELIL